MRLCRRRVEVDDIGLVPTSELGQLYQARELNLLLNYSHSQRVLLLRKKVCGAHCLTKKLTNVASYNKQINLTIFTDILDTGYSQPISV